MIETLKTFIKEQLQNTKEYLVEYTPEKLANSKTYAALYIANTALAEQLEQRADELELAYEHESNRAKLLEEEAAQKREEEGWWNAVLAVGTIVIGTVAIVCTAGAATPIVVTAAIAGGSTIAYGTSNLIEASQDIYYGSIGDAHTVAFNPIRDTIFMGNQEAYDLWGGISTTVAGLIVPVGQTYTAAKAVGQTGKTLIGTVGKSAVKEVAQDALVGAASSKAGSLVMNLTGDANLSRLAGLGTGILSGSKTGKALNSIDNAVSSTVKSVRQLDDVANVTNAFDDVSGTVKLTDNITVVNYGDQFSKLGRSKRLKSNVEYTDSNGYKYRTDGVGRISHVEGQLQLGTGKRNPYAQRTVGGDDRLPTDDGGHLIATQFNGSGEIDNLLPQSSNINRAGGEWYAMERDWADALKNNMTVKVDIEPIYSDNSMRPERYQVKYWIDGEQYIKTIINQ